MRVNHGACRRRPRLGVRALTLAVTIGLTWLSIGPAAAGARSPVPKSRKPKESNPFLTGSVRGYLSHRHSNVTAAVYDVRTGINLFYRPTVHERTASIVKVDILATLLHEAQERGRGLTASQNGLAHPMIEESDNDAAQTLWNQAGGSGAITPFDRQIGMTNTTPNVNGYFGLTFTTAPDQIKLLRQVMLPGGILSVSARKYAYELMLHVTPSQRWGITGGVPRSARVAIKDGWLPKAAGWQVNSIGSVIGSGRNYLIAILTNDDPSWDYGISTIQHLSAAVWRALRPRS